MPVDFLREAIASHPSRAGGLRSERGSESSRQHRNRDAVKGRVVTRDFRSVRKCYCIAPRVDAGGSRLLDSREEMHGMPPRQACRHTTDSSQSSDKRNRWVGRAEVGVAA